MYLISGGSSGIGLKLAEELSSDGHRVVSLSRSREKIRRALKERPHVLDLVEFVEGDISNTAGMEGIARHMEEKYGLLHGLVNNAGVLSKGTIETTSAEVWQHTLDVNLTGPYNLTRAVLPLLRKAGGASVVNISSVAGLKPGTSISYSVSKAGLDMLTRFLAGDLGPYGIRVNSVNPGLVETPIHLDNQIFSDRESYRAMLEKARPRYPIGRIGKPEDITAMIRFLLSDAASWVSGSIISVDGGVMVENDLIPPK